MTLVPVPGDYRPPGLVKEPIYYAEIPKKLISKVLDALKAVQPEGTVNMQHIKRVQPVRENPANLNVLLCSQSSISSDDLLSLLTPISGFDLRIESGNQSKYPARSKEEAEEWSKEVWPLMWRGNTAAQPPAISSEDEEIALKTLSELSALSAESNDSSECTHFCWIRDPTTDTIVGKGNEDLNRVFSKSHAVMEAIDCVAQHHKQHEAAGSHTEAGYLCFGMDVFCNTEPCIMCCMALVHSRIGRLFYSRSSSYEKGAIEFYCLHGRSQLNHTYEAWRLVDQKNEKIKG